MEEGVLAGAGGLHTTYKVLGRSKGFKKGTRKFLLDWTLLTREQAAADPEGWRYVLLGRALIQEPFYTSVAHAMRGAGRELPELPPRRLPDGTMGPYFMYEGVEVSTDVTDECPADDEQHRVDCHDDFLNRLADALQVDNKVNAWGELQSVTLGRSGYNGEPTEDDVTIFAGRLGAFFESTGPATWADWNKRTVADQVICNCAGAGGEKDEIKAALKVGRPAEGEDTWEQVIVRLGALVTKMADGEATGKMWRKKRRSRSRSPTRRRRRSPPPPPPPRYQRPQQRGQDTGQGRRYDRYPGPSNRRPPSPSRDFPFPHFKRCYGCGQVGHIRRDCRERGSPYARDREDWERRHGRGGGKDRGRGDGRGQR